MKRNNELLYKILEALKDDERASTDSELNSFTIGEHSRDEIHYNCLLLRDAGLVYMEKGATYPSRLTWEGYIFLVGPVPPLATTERPPFRGHS